MKKNIKKPVAIAALLGSLAVGGGSYALWSDSADVNSGTITSGLLDVNVVNSEAVDVSPDRTDSPHAITDLTKWKAVPGDVVELRSNVDVALQGDNLVAKLNTKTIENAIPDAAKQYVKVTAEIRDTDGKVLANPVMLQAEGAGQESGADDANIKVVGSALDSKADVQAIYTITFDKSTPNQVLTNSKLADLSSTGVTLEQVRDAGVGNFK